jgi:hypothetical protein
MDKRRAKMRIPGRLERLRCAGDDEAFGGPAAHNAAFHRGASVSTPFDVGIVAEARGNG